MTSLPQTVGRYLLEFWPKALTIWLRWFWSLSVVGKLVLTAVEIVALYLVALRLPLNPARQHELVEIGALGLMFLFVFGVLFGSIRTR